jgi:NTP pyrophosphatase (non-canonical NTP hydrolase)
MDLMKAAYDAVADSERWFPENVQEPFFSAACMAGEAGEVINLLKKVERGSHPYDENMKAQVFEEVADVFTYMLKLAGELGMDLEAEYRKKREINDVRFSARRSLEADDDSGRHTQVIPRLPRQVLAEAGVPVGDVTQTWQTPGEFAS